MSTDADWNGLLDADEHIVWQGAPTGAFRWEFDSLFVFFFMIVWAGIPLTMILINPIALLLGIPTLFVAVGIWFFVGQHFWAMFMRRRTFYSLSNKRAFIAKRKLTKRQLKSYPITADTVIELDDHAGGGVWFAVRKKHGGFSGKGEQKIGFDQLSDPRAVYATLRQVQQGQL